MLKKKVKKHFQISANIYLVVSVYHLLSQPPRSPLSLLFTHLPPCLLLYKHSLLAPQNHGFPDAATHSAVFVVQPVYWARPAGTAHRCSQRRGRQSVRVLLGSDVWLLHRLSPQLQISGQTQRENNQFGMLDFIGLFSNQ